MVYPNYRGLCQGLDTSIVIFDIEKVRYAQLHYYTTLKRNSSVSFRLNCHSVEQDKIHLLMLFSVNLFMATLLHLVVHYISL